MGAVVGEEKNPADGGDNLVEGEVDSNLAEVEDKYVARQNKKVKKRKRSELEKIKKEELCDVDKTKVLVDAEEPASEPSFPWTWSATYYTKLCQRQKPLYKGSILVDPKVNRVALLDNEEITIDARNLKKGELIYPILVLEFPCHIVQIGMRILRGVDRPSRLAKVC